MTKSLGLDWSRKKMKKKREDYLKKWRTRGVKKSFIFLFFQILIGQVPIGYQSNQAEDFLEKILKILICRKMVSFNRKTDSSDWVPIEPSRDQV